jgi:hypothetical protein
MKAAFLSLPRNRGAAPVFRAPQLSEYARNAAGPALG